MVLKAKQREIKIHRRFLAIDGAKIEAVRIDDGNLGVRFETAHGFCQHGRRNLVVGIERQNILAGTNPDPRIAGLGEAAVGLDTSDPAAKDDVVTGTMYLPVDREVDVSLRSVDVIHSFFVPNLRFKQDAVPGLNIHLHFKPTAIGEYEILCAELCGLGHYKMHGMVHVVSQEDFDKWLAAREAEKQ